MGQEELEFEISPDGRVTVRTIGIKGPKCVEVAETFIRILGTEQERELTAEYYELDLQVRQGLNIQNRRE